MCLLFASGDDMTVDDLGERREMTALLEILNTETGLHHVFVVYHI
jgi:hypothetical protein